MLNGIFVPYQGMFFQIPSNVKVIVQDKQKNTLYEQGLGDYLIKPNVNIAMASHGASLLDVLTNEQYLTTANDGSPGLKFIFTGDAHADATRLMGSIAEALIVQECNNSQEVNRELAKHARGGSRISDKADDYIAIATGSQITKLNYNHFYNPSDTQRDIIWIDKNNTEYQLSSISPGIPSSSAKPAGLQVKTSHNYKYVTGSIKQYHYPVIYFDLKNDWHLAFHEIQMMNKNNNSVTATLVPPDEVLIYLKSRLINYFNIIVALFNNECTLTDIIERSKIDGDSILAGVGDTAAPDSGSKIICELSRTTDAPTFAPTPYPTPAFAPTPAPSPTFTGNNRKDWFDDGWWADDDQFYN
ncbi:hypothetical protein [Enterobacter sp. CP102]|uniref:hypothetical protein n=1 Tax=Enterobacter sp. CP102 TaxID=2976431 RepID=UPI00220B5580|nr:hypothetical protein [Enterobacter sp. CP102]UWM66570.1 hypothetical protein N1249_23055 [Enterobacter sp. CP102]